MLSFLLSRATCQTNPILLDLITLVAFCRSKHRRAVHYESLSSVMLLTVSYIQIYISQFSITLSLLLVT